MLVFTPTDPRLHPSPEFLPHSDIIMEFVENAGTWCTYALLASLVSSVASSC